MVFFFLDKSKEKENVGENGLYFGYFKKEKNYL